MEFSNEQSGNTLLKMSNYFIRENRPPCVFLNLYFLGSGPTCDSLLKIFASQTSAEDPTASFSHQTKLFERLISSASLSESQLSRETSTESMKKHLTFKSSLAPSNVSWLNVWMCKSSFQHVFQSFDVNIDCSSHFLYSHRDLRETSLWPWSIWKTRLTFDRKAVDLSVTSIGDLQWHSMQWTFFLSVVPQFDLLQRTSNWSVGFARSASKVNPINFGHFERVV